MLDQSDVILYIKNKKFALKRNIRKDCYVTVFYSEVSSSSALQSCERRLGWDFSLSTQCLRFSKAGSFYI
jgi:hypothetical protein